MAMSPASAQFEHLGMLEADQRIHQLAFAPFGLGLTLLGQGVERLAGTRAKQALQVLQRNTLFIQGAPFGVIFGRRGGRHIEDVGLGTPLLMQGECYLVLVDQDMDRALFIIEVADPANPPYALLGTSGRQSFLDARVTENALFRL